ncbi:hypothetical protein TNCV_4764071 [Trichonephila clavipes]|nr:hypothetical protein TNCV_4764071 [Trichonephila clavipes]
MDVSWVNVQTEQSVYHTRHQTTCVDCQIIHCLGHPSIREYSRASCADDTSDPLPDPPPELTTPLLQIPDPPVQIPVFQPPVQISPVPTTPPVHIPDPTPKLTTPLLQIPDPPVQIAPVPSTPPVPHFLPDPPAVQILLPYSPPVVETLESTLMDDSSIDQIMSSVFVDCSQLPPAHTQEPRLLDTVPSLIDESNDLICFLDNFETGLAIEQQEAPMDLTMP